MSPARSLVLYAAFCGMVAVHAAPRPTLRLEPRLEVTLNLTEPTYADPPDGEGPWIACEFSDDNCGCTRLADGTLEHYCGWVDPTWIGSTGPGRRLGESDGNTTDDSGSLADDLGDIPDSQFAAGTPADPDTPQGEWESDDGAPDTTVSSGNSSDGASSMSAGQPAAAGTAGGSDGQNGGSGDSDGQQAQPSPGGTSSLSGNPNEKRDLNNEIRLRRRHPMLVALKILNFSYRKLVVPSLSCITTKLPKSTQGGALQGITGQFNEAVKINDGAGFVHTFKKGATFELRWDVTSWLQVPNVPANAEDFQGLHVNMVIQDSQTYQKWAFYQQGTSTFPAWPDFVGEYLRVRKFLTDIAGYHPAHEGAMKSWAAGSENLGAQAIAKFWHNRQNPHDEL